MSGNTWQVLREIFVASGYSLRELEAICGIPKSNLERVLSGKTALTVPTLQALAVALDFDPRDVVSIGEHTMIEAKAVSDDEPTIRSAEVMTKLLRRAKELDHRAGQELTLDRALGWYHATGGRLENADRILPYLSIFRPMSASDDHLQAVHIGTKCLAHESLATTDPAEVNAYIDTLAEETRKEILFSYFSTQASQTYQVHSRQVVVNLPTLGRPYQLDYATLLLPMTGFKGRDVVVNHSVLVSVKFLDPHPIAPRGSGHNTQLSVETLRG